MKPFYAMKIVLFVCFVHALASTRSENVVLVEYSKTHLFDTISDVFDRKDTPPSMTKHKEKKLTASDGAKYDRFGGSCSMSDELVVIGSIGVDTDEAQGFGSAYLFHLDGTELRKFVNPDPLKYRRQYGWSASIHEKIVIGSTTDHVDIIPPKSVDVFSRDGTFERSITCEECYSLGRAVATHGKKIVTSGYQNKSYKLFLYTVAGELLKIFDVGGVDDLAISEQFIVSTTQSGKTTVFLNEAPDFPKVVEIPQGGTSIALSGDALVIGNRKANQFNGDVWLYKTDGALVKKLDRKDSSPHSEFGGSVAITDEHVVVGAICDDDDGDICKGSVFIYSSITGEFVEKVLVPGGKAQDEFGASVCASGSHYAALAKGVDGRKGAAYLFPFSYDDDTMISKNQHATAEY